MNKHQEMRAALQALVDATERCERSYLEADERRVQAALADAKALLARPEPEPRITREEAIELLDKYAWASIDQWSRPMSEDGLYKQASAFEACLAAMLRPEADVTQKTATPTPRMKPRTVPLDQDEIAPEWQPIASAPKDSTPIILLVRADDDSKPTEDHDYFRTIGHNSFDDDGEDWWEMAGWCRSHDHYTETSGTPIAWMPLPSPPAASDGEKP